MRLIKKNLIAMLICLILLVIIFIVPILFRNLNYISVRTVDVSSLSLSIEEKLEKFEKKFDSIETLNVGETAYFNAKLNFDKKELMSTGYVGQDVDTNYKAKINFNDNLFIMKSEIVVNNNIEEEYELEYFTEYDENVEKLYLIDSNGNKIDIISEVLQNDVDECFALTLGGGIAALIAALAALLIVPPIIEILPDVTDAIKSLTEGVVDEVRKFWDRLKLACGGITANELSNEIVLNYDIAQQLQHREGKHIYLLLNPISSDSDITIPYQITDIENAINWVKKGGSVWSPTSVTARNAITGTNKYKPGIVEKGLIKLYKYEESKINGLVFKHYHAITKKNVKIERIHSFFGVPSYNRG